MATITLPLSSRLDLQQLYHLQNFLFVAFIIQTLKNYEQELSKLLRSLPVSLRAAFDICINSLLVQKNSDQKHFTDKNYTKVHNIILSHLSALKLSHYFVNTNVL